LTVCFAGLANAANVVQPMTKLVAGANAFVAASATALLIELRCDHTWNAAMTITDKATRAALEAALSGKEEK